MLHHGIRSHKCFFLSSCLRLLMNALEFCLQHAVQRQHNSSICSSTNCYSSSTISLSFLPSSSTILFFFSLLTEGRLSLIPQMTFQCLCAQRLITFLCLPSEVSHSSLKIVLRIFWQINSLGWKPPAAEQF